MSETTETLFRTPQDALVFAFNYSMQTRDRPAMDRLAAPSTHTGKGLSGNDGAAQAGMIRRQLTQLSKIDQAVLIARFAPRSWPCACGSPCCSGNTPNPEYLEAIDTLQREALTQLSGFVSNYRLRRSLVLKAVGVKIEIAAVAKECGVSERTAASHWKIIKEWMGGRPKQKSANNARARVSAGSAHADVADDQGAELGAGAASDGISSLARKRADDLLSGLPFIRT